ncbi:MAG: WD40 repeat domain-containing protein [Eubacteriales bacterium]
MRRVEIISELRRTMYIEPFSIVAKLDMQNARLNNAVISPDGTKAACIANGNAVAVIDLDKNKVLYTVSVDSEDVSSISFSRDSSRFLAVCGNNGCAAVWNTADGSEVYRYTSELDREAMIANAAFWKGPDSILVQDYDRFYLISLPDGEKTHFYTIGDQQEGYNYDNNLLTMGLGKPIDKIITELSDNYTRSAMLVSQDGTKVVIGGRDGKTGTIVLNDKGERIALLDRLPGTVMEYYDLSEDGRYVVSRSLTGFLGLWETETGRMKFIHSLNTAFKEGVNAVTMTEAVISPDSSMMAYVTENTLVIEDLPKGKERVRIELEETEFPPRLSWSDDSRYVCFFNPSLYTVDARDGSVVLFRKGDVSNPFNNVLPVGDRMIFVTRGGGEAICYSLPAIASIRTDVDYDGGRTGYDPRYEKAEAWETPPQGEHHVPETFQSLLKMKDEPSDIYYSRDGRYAALLYPDGAIEVFRQEDSSKVYLLNNQYTAAPAAFGISGDTMCASDSKGRLLFQNLADGTMTVLNTGSPRTVFMFDSSGDLLMAASDDAADADVYAVKEAEKLFTVSGASALKAIGFSEDGEQAVAVTTDGQILTAELWRNETKLLAASRRLAP